MNKNYKMINENSKKINKNINKSFEYSLTDAKKPHPFLFQVRLDA